MLFFLAAVVRRTAAPGTGITGHFGLLSNSFPSIDRPTSVYVCAYIYPHPGEPVNDDSRTIRNIGECGYLNVGSRCRLGIPGVSNVNKEGDRETCAGWLFVFANAK